MLNKQAEINEAPGIEAPTSPCQAENLGFKMTLKSVAVEENSGL